MAGLKWLLDWNTLAELTAVLQSEHETSSLETEKCNFNEVIASVKEQLANSITEKRRLR
jgi:hypothetical protein